MRDKKVDQMIELLFPLADRVVLWELDNPRAASINILQELARNQSGRDQIVRRSFAEERLRHKSITPAPGMICFTGSLYLVGAARELLVGKNAARW